MKEINEIAFNEALWTFMMEWRSKSDQTMSNPTFFKLSEMLTETIKKYLEEADKNENDK